MWLKQVVGLSERSALLTLVLALALSRNVISGQPDCQLDEKIVRHIQGYQEQVNSLIKSSLNQRISAYSNLKDFVTKFGPRPSGSEQLEKSIEYIKKMAEADGFTVYTEKVMVPHWVRGEESLQMLSPHTRSMSLLGLGGSIGSQQFPGGVLVAEAVVVDTFEEMQKLGRRKIEGKIVVVNAEFGRSRDEPFDRYRFSNQYRTESALRASQLGAAAVLVRSRTDYSLYSPHTGSQQQKVGRPPGNSSSTPVIPAAAITVEDSQMMRRLFDQGQVIRLALRMSAATLPDSESRNLIVELGGGAEGGAEGGGEELVVLSAHADSWDVGDGALDNGAGVFVNYHSLRALKELRMRRRVRAVFWTAEEQGYYGGRGYVSRHADEMDRVQAAIENDLGSFRPLGLRFNGSEEARCMVQHVARLLAPLNATRSRPNAVLSEVHLLHERRVPALSLDTEQTRYFWYHHTQADTLEALSEQEMQQCVAVMASTAYVLADMQYRLPR